MTDELRDHYRAKYLSEETAVGWQIVTPRRFAGDRFVAAVTALCGALPNGASVLEVGAGDGTIAASLLNIRPDLSFILGDTSESRQVGLQRRFDGDSRVSIVHMDAEHVGGVQVDAVLMVALIEHLIDPLRAMQRVSTVLKPGGFAYIDTPNIAKWTRRVKLAAGRFPSTAARNEGLTTYSGQPVDLYDEGHLHYFTFRSISEMLVSRCGFASVEPAPYWIGPGPQWIGGRLAAISPGLFSELAVIARRRL